LHVRYWIHLTKVVDENGMFRKPLSSSHLRGNQRRPRKMHRLLVESYWSFWMNERQSRQDGSGWRPLGESKPNILLELLREIEPKWGWSTTFWWQIKASTRTFLVDPLKQVIEIPLWGHDLIINHGHISWKLHDLLVNCLFPLPLCNKLLLVGLNIRTPELASFSWKLSSWLSLSVAQMEGYNLEGIQSTNHNLQSGLGTNLWRGPCDTWCYLPLDLTKSKANGGAHCLHPWVAKHGKRTSWQHKMKNQIIFKIQSMMVQEKQKK
jgi:hypothetical protein